MLQKIVVVDRVQASEKGVDLRAVASVRQIDSAHEAHHPAVVARAPGNGCVETDGFLVVGEFRLYLNSLHRAQRAAIGISRSLKTDYIRVFEIRRCFIAMGLH